MKNTVQSTPNTDQTAISSNGPVPSEHETVNELSTISDQEVNERKEITSTKIEFLIHAIEEVQETNRFLDTKAGLLALFESSLLIVVVSNLIDPTRLQLIQAFINRLGAIYSSFLIVFSISYALALVGHILITLKGVFPQEAPMDHVVLGDFRPKELFYLYKLDEDQVIKPSLLEYIDRLATMSDDDIAKEYVYELLKLSYIRKTKSDSLVLSFKILNFLIIGTVVLGFLLVLGGLL